MSAGRDECRRKREVVRTMLAVSDGNKKSQTIFVLISILFIDWLIRSLLAPARTIKNTSERAKMQCGGESFDP